MNKYERVTKLNNELMVKQEKLIKLNRKLARRLAIDQLLGSNGIKVDGKIKTRIAGQGDDVWFEVLRVETDLVILSVPMKDVVVSLWPTVWQHLYPVVPSLRQRMSIRESQRG